MALSLNEVQALTNDYWLLRGKQKVSDIVFRGTVLLWYLFGKGKFSEGLVQPSETVDGGLYIRVPVEYARSNWGGYGVTTKISKSKVKTMNAARFPWGGVHSSNSIDFNDRVQNSGTAAMVNITTEKINNMAKTVREMLAISCYKKRSTMVTSYGGVAADYILGLQDIFDSTTSTKYADIAEADVSQWAHKVSATPYSIGLQALQALRGLARVGETIEGVPNLYMTTYDLKDSFTRTLQTQQRFENPELAKAGFPNVMFEEAPLVADDYVRSAVGTTYVIGVNTKRMWLKTHPDFAFTSPEWKADIEYPDNWVANIRWVGQLVTDHRSAHAQLSAVTA